MTTLSTQVKPARLIGLLWGLFSAMAMISAFVLPVHVFAIMAGFLPRVDAWYFKLYFFVLFFSALYHGLYRLKTVLKDLKIL